jgi:hypothetical protein
VFDPKTFHEWRKFVRAEFETTHAEAADPAPIAPVTIDSDGLRTHARRLLIRAASVARTIAPRAAPRPATRAASDPALAEDIC